MEAAAKGLCEPVEVGGCELLIALNELLIQSAHLNILLIILCLWNCRGHISAYFSKP